MLNHPFQTPPVGSLASALLAAATEKAKTESPIKGVNPNQAKKRKLRMLPKSEISKFSKRNTKAETRALRPRK